MMPCSADSKHFHGKQFIDAHWPLRAKLIKTFNGLGELKPSLTIQRQHALPLPGIATHVLEGKRKPRLEFRNVVDVSYT